MKSKDDLLQDCFTIIKDLMNGYPLRELHMDPETLLDQIKATGIDLDTGEDE